MNRVGAAVAIVIAAASAFAQATFANEVQDATPASSGNFYTGDAKVVAVARYAGSVALARPRAVRVEDFSVQPDAVSIDESLAARLHRHHQLRKGQDVDSTPEILAQHVQAAFSAALVEELATTHLPVSTPADTVAALDTATPDLIVNGEFTAVDEGDETRRVLVGFGMGASDVKAHVTVSVMTSEGAVVVLSLDMAAESNKKPGAAITSGGSLAAGTAKKAFGDRKAKVEKDAARMGTLAARQIEGLLSDRDWMPVAQGASVVPVRSTSP